MPTGVSILPRFAAMVWSTTVGTSSRVLISCPASPSTVRVKGTKVMSATSFVMSMLEKKQSRTKIMTSCQARRTLVRRVSATHWNSPVF